ncbi:hypothetical protein PVAND_011284 [Polypedilum vanderplanki]|uniref:Structural maintenance of chromosomes protein n=1 Tax=Polypedilum vanderplanki TaxID=319348 RepID=A0A9J6CIT7_POLVA|nr:hypothetical protein PVAND_011284 [Polypedilum vanderplanki]
MDQVADMNQTHQIFEAVMKRLYELHETDIDIDHKEQILRLSEVEGAVSSTKSLSGGERSYSTVAFLISLWNCVVHPFFFLEEYDVFSDEYNRHTMTLFC